MPNTTRFVYMIINKDAKLKDQKKKKKIEKITIIIIHSSTTQIFKFNFYFF